MDLKRVLFCFPPPPHLRLIPPHRGGGGNSPTTWMKMQTICAIKKSSNVICPIWKKSHTPESMITMTTTMMILVSFKQSQVIYITRRNKIMTKRERRLRAKSITTLVLFSIVMLNSVLIMSVRARSCTSVQSGTFHLGDCTRNAWDDTDQKSV